jgi:hypothetical protein
MQNPFDRYIKTCNVLGKKVTKVERILDIE